MAGRPHMTSLVWGIKGSLLNYVNRMEDGVVELDGVERESNGELVFAGSGLRFTGVVRLTGHSGMMRVVLADPALVETPSGWALELGDDAGERLRFASIATFDGVRGTGLTLTEEGSDLFFGPYEEGTPLDDFYLR